MTHEPIRILLIEDEPECALLMEAFLRSSSKTLFTFALDKAEDLAGGLALLKEKEYDVLLLDLMLPDSRGLETLGSVRRLGTGVPVIVMTGLRDEDLGRGAIAAGAQDFLSKGDFNSETLRHVVRFAFERSRLQGQFEHILECSPDGALVLGEDGVVRYANPSAAVLFNRPLKEMVGRLFDHAVGPEKPAEIVLRVEGGERTVELSSARIEWKRDPALLVTVRDVTVLKMIGGVRAAIEERTRLEDSRERFLQAVAHDLRSPIGVVAAVVERCRELMGEPSGQGERLIETGRAAVARVKRLVEGLLSLWQLESGEVTVCREPLDLALIVEGIAEGARVLRPDREIVVEVQPDLPAVFGDEDMIGRLVANLLDNAVRFARKSVTVRLRRSGPGRVGLSVIDDGPGVPEGKAAALFHRFARGERFADESGYKGTGLGLSLCREIVRVHGGSVSVERPAGGGAAFHVSLPDCWLAAGAGSAPRGNLIK